MARKSNKTQTEENIQVSESAIIESSTAGNRRKQRQSRSCY